MGWDTYLQGHPGIDGPPIRGSVPAFRAAEGVFSQIADDVSSIAGEFRALQGSEHASFQGQAAQAFSEVIADALDRLDQVPRIAQAVAQTFGIHAEQLEGLNAVGANLRARAETAWSDRQASRNASEHASSQLSSIQRQIDSLPGPDPTTGIDDRRPQLEGQRASWRSALDRHDADVRRAEQRLAGSAGDYRDLRDLEDNLDQQTSRRLDDQDLWDLGNPGLVDRAVAVLQGVGDWLAEFWELSTQLLSAFADGQWTETLQILDELLSRLSTVLLVVTVAAIVIVAAAAGAGFIALPAALGLLSTINVAVAGAGLAISVAQLAVTSGMLATGTDRLDGREVSWRDLAVDTLTAGLAVVGLRHAVHTNQSVHAFNGVWRPGGRGVHAFNAARLREHGMHAVQSGPYVNNTILTGRTVLANNAPDAARDFLIDEGLERFRTGWPAIQPDDRIELPDEVRIHLHPAPDHVNEHCELLRATPTSLRDPVRPVVVPTVPVAPRTPIHELLQQESQHANHDRR